MPAYRITDQAEDDLFGIALHIAQDDAAAAERFIDRIHQKCQMLAEQPGMGPKREELASGLRSLRMGNYLIFYRTVSDGVEVVRVLSGYRDLDTLFDSGLPPI